MNFKNKPFLFIPSQCVLMTESKINHILSSSLSFLVMLNKNVTYDCNKYTFNAAPKMILDSQNQFW